jgi:hypothetical protein
VTTSTCDVINRLQLCLHKKTNCYLTTLGLRDLLVQVHQYTHVLRPNVLNNLTSGVFFLCSGEEPHIEAPGGQPAGAIQGGRRAVRPVHLDRRRITSGGRSQRRSTKERTERTRRQSEAVSSIIQLSAVAEARMRPRLLRSQRNETCPRPGCPFISFVLCNGFQPNLLLWLLNPLPAVDSQLVTSFAIPYFL